VDPAGVRAAPGPRHEAGRDAGHVLTVPLPVGRVLGGAADPAAFAEMLRAVEHAEAVGLHSVWLPEGHFSPGASASPLCTLAAFAARTRRLRLGTTSLLLSVHHPLRVAEEAAAVDALSEGRLWLGLGRGFRAPVFRGFGVEPATRRDRFDASVDAILAAWSGEAVTLSGPHFETLAGRAVRAALAPTQRPHPPLLVAAFGRKGLLQAAERGLPYLASPLESLDVLAENHAFHRAHLARPLPAGVAHAPVIRTVFVAGDDAEARRVRNALAREARALPTRNLPSALARAAAATPDERALVGTASEVADRLARYRERIGMDLLIARLEVPGTDAKARNASLDRLLPLTR